MPSDSSGPKRTPRPAAPRASEPTVTGRGDGAEPDDGLVAGVATATIAAPAAVDASGPPTSDVTEVPAAATPPPVAVAHSPGGRRRRGRRVTRVVRRIDLWSVLKLSLFVYACLYAAILGTLAALWGLAYSSGSVDKVRSFLEDVGLENFTFYGNQMFRACAAVGAIGVIAGTIVTVLATALINVISEVSGGIRLVVIEEDVDRR